jgi:hypothetical protein
VHCSTGRSSEREGYRYKLDGDIRRVGAAEGQRAQRHHTRISRSCTRGSRGGQYFVTFIFLTNPPNYGFRYLGCQLHPVTLLDKFYTPFGYGEFSTLGTMES